MNEGGSNAWAYKLLATLVVLAAIVTVIER